MEITDSTIIPVILSGGSGTRLWPLSRESYPKQFLALDSRTKKTLLQKTYERLLGLDGLKNPILICNEDHRFIVAEQFSCLLYTSPSPRDLSTSRMPSSA